MGQTPAGWYPQEDGRLRFWDGGQWTESVMDPTTAVLHEGTGSDAGSSAVRSRKPWFRRTWVLVAGAVLAFFLIIGALNNGSEQQPTAGQPAPSTSSAVVNTPNAEAQAQAKAEADAKAKAEADAKAKAEADAKAAAEAAKKAEAAAKQTQEAERRREAALRDTKSYPAISARQLALVAKSPDTYVGKKYVIYGRVTQFDAATGDDTFRADIAARRQSDWYDYEINSVITAQDAALVKNVVQDDLVTLYVEVMGSLSYDTQIGGSTTVPAFRVNIIKVTGSTS